MSTNKYKLGADYLPSIDEETEWLLELDSLRERPHRVDEYFSALKYNLNKDNDQLCQRVCDAYNYGERIYIPTRAFVTDNIDLFTEMYRILKIDFVYDFKTKFAFVDLFGGHEIVMGTLYAATGKSEKYESPFVLAEKYVAEGLGFYKSSQSRRVWLGPETPIPDFFRPWKTSIVRME